MIDENKNPSIARILTNARGLITGPHKWTQRKYARNKNSLGVNVSDKNAVCFCAKGAILHSIYIYYEPYSDDRFRIVDIIDKIFSNMIKPFDNITAWNDVVGRKQEEVLNMFDKAIEIAKSLDTAENESTL